MNYSTLIGAFIILTALVNIAHAEVSETASLDRTITDEDKANFDNMLTPLSKIYAFARYAVTLIAGVFILFAGYQFMSAGNDVLKKTQAKNTASYVFIGVAIIWAAPYFVNYLLG